MFSQGRQPAAAKQPAKANRPAQEVEAEKLQKKRKALLRTVAESGTMPEVPSAFFMPHNKDFYNVNMDQVISCKAKPGALEWQLGHKKRTEARKISWINCGHPTVNDQDAGKVLAGTWSKSENGVLECEPWPFTPLATEMYECAYTNPLVVPPGSKVKAGGEPVKVPDPTRVPDPSKDIEVGKTLKYSLADIAGRYAGHKALCTPATTAWTTFVLGCDIDYSTGKPITASIPTEHTSKENDTLYDKQREAVRKAISKIYLVYPYYVDGCIGPNGEIYPLDELERANEDEREPVPITHEDDEEAALFAPQPVQFVSIASDKSEGAPGQNIAGFHDTTRAWPLPPGHVEQLRKILTHYVLEKDFPLLANLHAKRNSSMLDLEHHRQRYLEDLGNPPVRPCNKDELVCKKWLEERAAIPFGKVWVQKCDPQHPHGYVIHGTNTPLLVPLLKNRAEDRNGTPWLDVEKIDRTTPNGELHYVHMQTVLHRIVGKAWNKGGQTQQASGKRKLALTVRDQDDGDTNDPMLASLNRATTEANRLAKLNEHLESALKETQAALKKAKMEKPHMVLTGTGQRFGLVDFINGRDAKCILRWDCGRVQVDFGDGTEAKPIMSDAGVHTLTVRFQPNVEQQNLPDIPREMLMEDEDDAAGESDDAGSDI